MVVEAGSIFVETRYTAMSLESHMCTLIESNQRTTATETHSVRQELIFCCDDRNPLCASGCFPAPFRFVEE